MIAHFPNGERKGAFALKILRTEGLLALWRAEAKTRAHLRFPKTPVGSGA